MVSAYMLTDDDLFRIADNEAFEAAALETFRFQAERCAPYRQYLALIGMRPGQIHRPEEIPHLPIGLFKTHDIYCGDAAPEAVFTSSSTTGMTPSRHAMRSLALYEQAFRASFRTFYGEPRRWSLYALLPNYLRRKGSSLVYMADRLIADCGSGGFYLDDYERLLDDMAADPKPKILLGVSYALWDLAERYSPKLKDTVVMETGGMKGYREELPKEEFHRILCDAFGVEVIHSEYGMAELTSQAYSLGGNRFRCRGGCAWRCATSTTPSSCCPTARAAASTSPTWPTAGRAPSSRPRMWANALRTARSTSRGASTTATSGAATCWCSNVYQPTEHVTRKR